MYYDGNGFYHLTTKSYMHKKELEALAGTNSNKIIFRHGHIAICGYHMGDNRAFEKSLSVWDDSKWRYNRVAGYYVERLKEFRINRGYDINQLYKYFPFYEFCVDNDAYPDEPCDIKLYTEPRDDFQKAALTFMMAEGEYSTNKKFSQQLIEARTGRGKTFLSVASACYYQSRVVIFVPFEKLLNQWKESFLNFTSLKKDEILIVQGSKVCKEIRREEHKNIKVFLFMVDTLTSYNKSHGDLKTIEMLRATKARIKIIDEVHRNIKAVSMIEALSNFRLNFYLSASPGRTDHAENRIFNELFYMVPRFGANFEHKSEKYLNILIKNYRFTPTKDQLKKMVDRRKKWLRVKEYEHILINAPEEQRRDFEKSMLAMLQWAKKNKKPENRILILMSTIDGTEYIQKLAEQVFPGETSRYYGSMPSKSEKKKALEQMVICATDSSLGTGSDIPKLQFAFVCTTYTAWTQAIQMSGRLRRLPGSQCVYCELVNVGFDKTLKQYQKRKDVLMKQSKTGKLIIID